MHSSLRWSSFLKFFFFEFQIAFMGPCCMEYLLLCLLHKRTFRTVSAVLCFNHKPISTMFQYIQSILSMNIIGNFTVSTQNFFRFLHCFLRRKRQKSYVVVIFLNADQDRVYYWSESLYFASEPILKWRFSNSKFEFQTRLVFNRQINW